MARKRKPGFALLEVLVFLLVLLVLVAAVLASAGNLHSRSVRRASSDRAYYAALAAVRMLAGDIAEGGSTAAFGDTEMTLSIAGEGDMTVTVRSTGKQEDSATKKIFLTLTGTATVGDETETVELKLQQITADQMVPSTLFGMGFAGTLDHYGANFKLELGPDTDLCFYGQTGTTLWLENVTVGGNLIVRNSALNLKNSSVGGMLVSDGDMTLRNTLVGEQKDPAQPTAKRMAGVCVTGGKKLTLEPGANLGGPAYAAEIEAGDGVTAQEGLYCTTKTLREEVVFSHDGETRYTSAPKLGRWGGLVFGAAKTWYTLDANQLNAANQLLQQGPQLFVPNFPADMARREVSGNQTLTAADLNVTEEGLLITVKKDGMLSLDAAPADPKGNPAIFIILEEQATLSLETGGADYYLNVYGMGNMNDNTRSELKTANGVTVYGTLQQVELDTTSGGLRMLARQPSKLAFQAPASQGRTAESWAVVETTQRPGA